MSLLKHISYYVSRGVVLGFIIWSLYLQYENYRLLNLVDERVTMVQMGQNSQFAIALIQGTYLVQLYHSVDHSHLEENKEDLKKDMHEINKLLEGANDPEAPIE